MSIRCLLGQLSKLMPKPCIFSFNPSHIGLADTFNGGLTAIAESLIKNPRLKIGYGCPNPGFVFLSRRRVAAHRVLRPQASSLDRKHLVTIHRPVLPT